LINTIYLKSLEKLEVLSVEDNVGRVKNEIGQIFEQSGEIGRNWIHENEAYLFDKEFYDSYIETNLVDDNFDRYDFDVIIVEDNSGQVLYGKQKDFETEEVKDLDGEVLNQIFWRDLFENENPRAEEGTFVIVDEKPIMISAHPIFKSNVKGQVVGTVVFGQIMDNSMMERITTKLKLKTTFELITNDSPELARNDSNMEIDAKNGKYITGSFYLPEMYKKYYIKISVEMPREIMSVGNNSIVFIVVLVSLMLIISFLLLLYYIDKLVINRIRRLNKQVIQIKESNAISARVDVDDGHDEISQLSEGINQMLGGLEHLQIEISKAKNTLETKVDERTKELQIMNHRLEIEIVERQKIKDEVTFQAYYDVLTGLPNRLLFTDRLNQGITLANRHEILISVMFIDLDSFKNINDALGHDQGDYLLRQVAERLSESIRKNDTVCRIGGDEFVILINGYNDENNLDTIALKFIDSFKNPFVLRGQEYYITASMGIAQYPVDGWDVETLMKNADNAMYAAKSLGKNQYQKCSKDLKDSAIETMLLTNSLHRAIVRNEMMLYYQPQVNGLTGEIEGVEVLLRWNHPELGFVSPMKFIPLAEKTRLILPIGIWVLKTACKQCKSWQEMGFKQIRMAVNFSLHQLNDPNIVVQVEEILKEVSLPPNYLEIELTESIAMERSGKVGKTLKQLKDLGVNLSIDDFGTEYSSLSRLKDLPIDRVKIDMSFIQGIGRSDKDETITKAVILLANTLGLDTVAEGVETKEQLDFLNNLMCHQVQGFYFYKPMPAGEMEKLLREIS
jgi:diguanylate cyclase (GGDEF)-like protein